MRRNAHRTSRKYILCVSHSNFLSRVLTLSEYKRVDDEEGDGGKLELEWWREPKAPVDPELEKLRKKLLKPKKRFSTLLVETFPSLHI